MKLQFAFMVRSLISVGGFTTKNIYPLALRTQNPQPFLPFQRFNFSGLIFASILSILTCLTGQITLADSIVITNNSFEGSTGYWALFNDPTSWAANFSGNTPGDSMNAQVVTGTSAGLTGFNGANVLDINLDVGGISGSSGTSWVSTKSLGIYQSNTVYTLTVAEASQHNNPTRGTTIALAAQGSIPSSGSPPAYTAASTSLNFTNLSTTFTDVTVVLNTALQPSLVGEQIAVLLEQNAISSEYGNEVFFDNVRLTTSPSPIPEPGVIGLLGLGGFLLLWQRRKAQHS